MTNTNKSEYKRKYAMAKHHAWAGSVLLAILGAIRWFTDDTEWYQKDIIFILAGVLIIIYILIALVFTYQFRSGLATEETNVRKISSNQKDQTMVNSINLSPKELEKIEKKKEKAESKRLKKLAKSQQKKEKESS
ncbi:MAG: hypothetical protein KGY65_03240 [Candidatus Thermoplasmatota archaeon]|nr:hypothetical protein [Candidatus Thermoplasmatota archaeon]MBS3801745.1 hypothetical protein [Candidatus Thermoplasmatota archaeon]